MAECQDDTPPPPRQSTAPRAVLTPMGLGLSLHFPYRAFARAGLEWFIRSSDSELWRASFRPHRLPGGHQW